MESFLALVVLLSCCFSVACSETETVKNQISNDNTNMEHLLNQIKNLTARVEELESQSDVKSEVAFSASLVEDNIHTHQGPYENNVTLLFKKVTTNIGAAYNHRTGIFTTPKRGVYCFTFTGSVGNSGVLNMALFKNGDNMAAIYETAGVHNSGANGIILNLEEGDEMYIVIWPGTSIFDNSRISTFSGFLLFPE